MLPPEMARAGLMVAAVIIVMSGAMLPFLDRGSPEYFITTFCLILGLSFGAGVWFFARRKPH